MGLKIYNAGNGEEQLVIAKDLRSRYNFKPSFSPDGKRILATVAATNAGISWPDGGPIVKVWDPENPGARSSSPTPKRTS